MPAYIEFSGNVCGLRVMPRYSCHCQPAKDLLVLNDRKIHEVGAIATFESRPFRNTNFPENALIKIIVRASRFLLSIFGGVQLVYSWAIIIWITSKRYVQMLKEVIHPS